MNSPKVSIIMPAYNVEDYIAETLDSALNQTLKDIEVLCIDDCSPDHSAKIIKEYAEKDNRVKYLKMPENSGSGPARNLGLDNAKGEFIAFMDPDDVYPSNTVLETLYNTALEKNVNACGGNIKVFTDNGNKISDPWEEVTFKASGMMSYEDYHFPAGYVRFIYKRDIIEENNVRFPAYPRRQDPVFFVKAMAIIKNFYVITEPTYKYRLKHKSMKWDERKLEGVLGSFADNFKVYEEHKLWNHLTRDYLDMQEYLRIVGDLKDPKLIKMAKEIINNVPYKDLYHADIKYNIPTKREYLNLIQENRIRKILIKLICTFVPVKKWRRRLRGKVPIV